jgi:small-conductance mechanosensitive channel
MDLDFPFSEAFGPAYTRDEMIISAEAVYYRLMMLSPGTETISFSNVFQILLLQEDGTEDKVKKRAIRNLFRPDADGQLSLVSFVQSCDTVYKKVRYFRASVGNASVIDHVLESIIDIVFFFFLGLIVLALLNFNPWPLLVSLSTLLVAGSFAIGPTCAKAIEVSCAFFLA